MFRKFYFYVFPVDMHLILVTYHQKEFGLSTLTFKHDIERIIDHGKHAKFNWINRIHQNKHLKRNIEQRLEFNMPIHS